MDEFGPKGWVSMPSILSKGRNLTGLINESILEVEGFSVLGGDKYQIYREAGGSPIAVGEGVNSKNFRMHSDSKLIGGSSPTCSSIGNLVC